MGGPVKEKVNDIILVHAIIVYKISPKFKTARNRDNIVRRIETFRRRSSIVHSVCSGSTF